MDEGKLLSEYFKGEMSLAFNETEILTPFNQDITCFIRAIIKTNINKLIDMITNMPYPEINSYSIPQFSNYVHGTKELVEILNIIGNSGLSYLDVGKYLLSGNRKKEAYIKYGENHAKLAELHDLVIIRKNSLRKAYNTVLGSATLSLLQPDLDILLTKLSLKIPIIKKLIIIAHEKKTSISNTIEFLSKSTLERRKPNIIYLLNKIFNNAEFENIKLKNNLILE